MNVPLKDTKPEELDFLVKRALELEAVEAKIIPNLQGLCGEKSGFKMQRMCRVWKKTYLSTACALC